jgi:rubrerythrin
MHLDALLDRCLAVERRAAALYRRFAAQAGAGSDLHAVWTRLAAEEDEHAAALAIARATIDPAVGAQSEVGGWQEALEAAGDALARGEEAAAPTADDQLTIALDLERTEIDALRQLLVALADQGAEAGAATSRHALELADVAARHSNDARVRLREAMIRAHARLDQPSPRR